MDAAQPDDAGARLDPDSGPEAAVTCIPTTELCSNAEDEDCDGKTDEASGVEEQCNGLDDDCDGLADEDLLKTSNDYKLWPQSIDEPELTQARLLPNGKGGAWLFYRAASNSNLQDETPRKINVISFAADGTSAGNAVEAELKTADTTRFVADGDGKWVAIFARTVASSPSSQWQELYVRLFLASTMEFVGETRIVYRQDRNYGTFLAPLAVSLFEDANGAVQVLVAYEADTQAAGAWGTALNLAYTRRAPSGLWSASNHYGLFANPGGATSVAIDALPCEEAWVVATATQAAGNDSRLARYTPDGSGNAELKLLPGTTRIEGIGTASSKCPGESELVLLHSAADGNTKSSRWALGHSGARTLSDEIEIPFDAPMYGAALHPWGGAWFVAGAGTDSALTLARLTFDSERRLTGLRGLDSTGPNAGALDGDGSSWPRGPDFSRVADLLYLGNALHVVVGNSFLQSNLTALLRNQSATTDQAAAMSFSLTCR